MSEGETYKAERNEALDLWISDGALGPIDDFLT